MSSESYHLESSDLQDGLRLLRRARLRGVVFLPRNGWVSLFRESEFGQGLDVQSAANAGVMLHHLYDEDAGWMFQIEDAGNSVCYYECRWLDWSDPEDRIKVKDDQLNLEVLEDLARRHGVEENVREQLERIVHPCIVRAVDEEGEDPDAEFDEFADWPSDEDDNVAHAFARLLKLSEYQGGWRHVKRHGMRTWRRAGGVEFRL